MSKFDVNEGTVEFWVKEGKLKWNDGVEHVLINLSNKEGSVFVVKDSDNKLKFFHVILGKGRTDVESDVSNFSSDEQHYIAVTWSMKRKEICLYVDGKQVAKSQISN